MRKRLETIQQIALSEPSGLLSRSLEDLDREIISRREKSDYSGLFQLQLARAIKRIKVIANETESI